MRHGRLHLSVRTVFAGVAILACALLVVGCGGGASSAPTLTVTAADDPASPPPGAMTLRSALEQAASGSTISFDPSLNGATITLSTVGSEHSVLQGEVYSGNTYSGYSERDYGRSALYVRKNITIDASALPSGITIKWGGDDSNRARVLAVYGDLTMKNVTISSGHSSAEAIAGGAQAYTLARGGGLAVWGIARLERCTIAGNRCTGEPTASRDRGTYGGGIYANALDLTDCIVSGNSVIGYGAGGGGIYSVGGPDRSGGHGYDNSIVRCAITGNRVTANHAYGGGIFTLSGGPTNLATLTLTNCTIARNLVEDNPALPNVGQFYYRGGGVYMGGGSLNTFNCTITENEVSGQAAVFSGKPNIGGGGAAATVGNAHTVENVVLRQSIVVGNKLNGAAEDWFTGSLLGFYSQGYNLLGVIDFTYILVPAPDWTDLCRKHYPKEGDRDGVAAVGAVEVDSAERHPSIISAGIDSGQHAIVWYPPGRQAVDQIPGGKYRVSHVRAGYTGFGTASDDFLNHVILKIRTKYGATLGANFGEGFGDLTGVTWYGPRVTWPSEAQNAAWVAFWRNVDTEIAGRLGPAGLNDEFWDSFSTGPLGSVVKMTVERPAQNINVVTQDQLGHAKPAGNASDIGAIER